MLLHIFNALWKLCAKSIVLQHLITVCSVTVLVYVKSCAGFALVEVSVSHHCVTVKLCERLALSALEARFHVEPYMKRTLKAWQAGVQTAFR
jgi:hypothetical protein